jgi:hypothetical protein
MTEELATREQSLQINQIMQSINVIAQAIVPMQQQIQSNTTSLENLQSTTEAIYTMLKDLSKGSGGSSSFADLADFLKRLMVLMSSIEDSLTTLNSTMGKATI